MTKQGGYGKLQTTPLQGHGLKVHIFKAEDRRVQKTVKVVGECSWLQTGLDNITDCRAKVNRRGAKTIQIMHLVWMHIYLQGSQSAALERCVVCRCIFPLVS